MAMCTPTQVHPSTMPGVGDGGEITQRRGMQGWGKGETVCLCSREGVAGALHDLIGGDTSAQGLPSLEGMKAKQVSPTMPTRQPTASIALRARALALARMPTGPA